MKRKSQGPNITPKGAEQILTITSCGGIFTWNWMCIVLCLSSSSFLSCSDIKVLPQEELLPDCSICKISWTKARNITFQEGKEVQISLIGKNNGDKSKHPPPLHHYSHFSLFALSSGRRLQCETNQWVSYHLLLLGWVNSGILRRVQKKERDWVPPAFLDLQFYIEMNEKIKRPIAWVVYRQWPDKSI